MEFNVPKYHLKSVSLFDLLSVKESQWIKTKLIRKEFAKGEFLLKENAFSKGVYIIRKGRVKIFQTNNEGKQSIVYIYGKGNFFGYRPVLANEPNPVSAVAMEKTIVSFISRESFNKVLADSSTLAKRLLIILSKEFSVWINKLTVYSQHGVKERVAMALLILDSVYQRNEDKLTSNTISISREDFAGFVGTAKETLVRMLRKFKDEKIITSKGTKIIILKHKALFNMVSEI